MAPLYGFHTTATEVSSDLASNIRGKTVLTTGVTPNSLGSHFVETIAAHAPALLILASRTQDTIDATTAAIHAKHPAVAVRGVVVDLSALASVRRAADEVAKMQQDEEIVIDVLMLNAGIMACPYGTTADGFERQFGTNHLGHFVFANRIIPGMLDGKSKSKQPRVVVVSSEGHQLGPVRWADPGFRGGEAYDKWRSYGQAKTANCLYAWALADKLGPKGLLAFSLHPGAIMTNLGRHIDVEGDDWTELSKLKFPCLDFLSCAGVINLLMCWVQLACSTATETHKAPRSTGRRPRSRRWMREHRRTLLLRLGMALRVSSPVVQTFIFLE